MKHIVFSFLGEENLINFFLLAPGSRAPYKSQFWGKSFIGNHTIFAYKLCISSIHFKSLNYLQYLIQRKCHTTIIYGIIRRLHMFSTNIIFLLFLICGSLNPTDTNHQREGLPVAFPTQLYRSRYGSTTFKSSEGSSSSKAENPKSEETTE